MKKNGVVNRQLAGELAALGHTDMIVVCDMGLPIPPGPAVVDLAFVAGTPSFASILRGLVQELVIDGAIAAVEVQEANPEVTELLTSHFSNLEYVPHEDFKDRTRQARLVVRTGEAQPYANVILRCGVPF